MWYSQSKADNMCGFLLLILLTITGFFVYLIASFPSNEEHYAANLIRLNNKMPDELRNGNINDGEDTYQLAYYYLHGEHTGYSNHPMEAFKWMQKSANLGNSDACYMLGIMYEAGIGTDVDLDKAELYYQKASPSKDPDTLESIQILNFTRAGKNEAAIPLYFTVSEEIEAYYIELLAQSYEELAYSLEPPAGYNPSLDERSRYFIIYSLLSSELPKELHPYIKEWKKAAEDIIRLRKGDKTLDIMKTWDEGIAAIQACNKRYPDAAALLSFEQAKHYINNKYNIEAQMIILKKESGNIAATCPLLWEFQVDFLRRLAYYLRSKCKPRNRQGR